jgi:hypothetical protein
MVKKEAFEWIRAEHERDIQLQFFIISKSEYIKKAMSLFLT